MKELLVQTHVPRFKNTDRGRRVRTVLGLVYGGVRDWFSRKSIEGLVDTILRTFFYKVTTRPFMGGGVSGLNVINDERYHI